VATALRYKPEVRNEDTYFKEIPATRVPSDMLQLAEHILEQKKGHFDPEKFEDRYEDALKKLIKAKKAGKEPPAAPAPKPSNVINLMDALRRGVGAEVGRDDREPLVEAGDEIFAMFKPNLREYAKDALEQRTVEVMTGARVESVSPTRVTLSTGEVISAHTLVWGAGLQGNELIRSLGLELERGNRIGVDGELRIASHPEVYAVGDIAAITDAKTKQVLPQLGSVALQSGDHAGETIANLVAGKETKPFKYRDKGTMAAIGRNAAVVQMLGGKTMKGHKAQFAWRTVHLALLPTNEDRAKAIVDWAGSQLTHQRVGRISVDADE